MDSARSNGPSTSGNSHYQWHFDRERCVIPFTCRTWKDGVNGFSERRKATSLVVVYRPVPKNDSEGGCAAGPSTVAARPAAWIASAVNTHHKQRRSYSNGACFGFGRPTEPEGRRERCGVHVLGRGMRNAARRVHTEQCFALRDHSGCVQRRRGRTGSPCAAAASLAQRRHVRTRLPSQTSSAAQQVVGTPIVSGPRVTSPLFFTHPLE